MVIEGLHTIWCQTADMDKSIAFYQGTLGLKADFTSPSWSQFTIGANVIGLHPSLEGETPPHGIFKKGWFIGIKVDDIKGLRAKLEADGATIFGDYHDVPGGVVLDFADPFGNVLEAHQAGLSAKDLG